MTTKPLVSICVMMSRPGGVDVTFEAMRDQTFKDFELVVVDNRYEKRRESMAAMAREYGLTLIHAPEHRKNGKWIVAAAGFNTSIALSRGEYVIILHDFTYVPPGWIESHLTALEGHPRRYVSADHVNVDLPEVAWLQRPARSPERYDTDRACTEVDVGFKDGHLDELCIFKGGRFDASWLPLPIGPQQWPNNFTPMWRQGQRPEYGWVTLTNDSMRRDLILDLNGIDERFDFGRGPFDANLGTRIENSGAETHWLTEPMATLLNPRFLMRTLPFGSHEQRAPGRWSNVEQRDYYSIVKNARPARVRAANPYNIKDLSRQLEPWRSPDVEKVPMDVPDIAYWRQVVGPETPALETVEV